MEGYKNKVTKIDLASIYFVTNDSESLLYSVKKKKNRKSEPVGGSDCISSYIDDYLP